MAGVVGFEPTETCNRSYGLIVRRLRPLGHTPWYPGWDSNPYLGLR